jgi:hypothetical protein
MAVKVKSGPNCARSAAKKGNVQYGPSMGAAIMRMLASMTAMRPARRANPVSGEGVGREMNIVAQKITLAGTRIISTATRHAAMKPLKLTSGTHATVCSAVVPRMS